MKVGIMFMNDGSNIVAITKANSAFLWRNSKRAKAYPPIEQNSSVSAVEAMATYKLQPRLRQNGKWSVRIFRLSTRSVPNHNGGGKLKIAVREWVANTNMK